MGVHPMLRIQKAIAGGPGGSNPNIVVLNNEAYEKAFSCARGTYQRDLISGAARWSGADIKGKAGGYLSKYKLSRQNLLERMKDAGIKFRWASREDGITHNKLVLIIEGLS